MTNWQNLSFDYSTTNYNIRHYYRKGQWGQQEISSSEKIDMHIAATSLHYSQQCFEGLKAYRGKDNKIRLFRWKDNAKRMRETARAIMQPEISDDLFFDALKKVIELNDEFVPPYGTGATLYIRPLLIGTGHRIGVHPADEYLFIIFAMPVGPYFKEGFKPVSIQITREFDRSASLGMGKYKVGGNYSAGLLPSEMSQKAGYASSLFLDPKEKKYIDECGPANFFSIKDNTYITPKSSSILSSITNKSLMTLAKDMGMKVEQRPVLVTELSEFSEVGACGTAAVITPIKEIVDPGTNSETEITYKYCKNKEAGEISTKLYKTLTGIQFGDIDDKFEWVTILS